MESGPLKLVRTRVSNSVAPWKALARPTKANTRVPTWYQTGTAEFTDPDYFIFVDVH